MHAAFQPFIVSNLPVDILANLIRNGRRIPLAPTAFAGVQRDIRDGILRCIFINMNSTDRRIGYTGMSKKDGLQLRWCNLMSAHSASAHLYSRPLKEARLPFHLDHLLCPVDQEQIPALVEVPDIPGPEPAIPISRSLQPRLHHIPKHEIRAPDQQLPRRTSLTIPPLLIHHPRLHARQQPPHAPPGGPLHLVLPLRRQTRTRLRHPIPLRDDAAIPRAQRIANVLLQRRRRVDQAPQRRQIPRPPLPRVQQRQRDRRHDVDVRDALALDRVQQRAHLETLEHHDRRALAHVLAAEAGEAEDVEEGHGEHEDGGGREHAGERGALLVNVGDDVGVREDHAFDEAGGAGAEADEGRGLGDFRGREAGGGEGAAACGDDGGGVEVVALRWEGGLAVVAPDVDGGVGGQVGCQGEAMEEGFEEGVFDDDVFGL